MAQTVGEGSDRRYLYAPPSKVIPKFKPRPLGNGASGGKTGVVKGPVKGGKMPQVKGRAISRRAK